MEGRDKCDLSGDEIIPICTFTETFLDDIINTLVLVNVVIGEHVTLLALLNLQSHQRTNRSTKRDISTHVEFLHRCPNSEYTKSSLSTGSMPLRKFHCYVQIVTSNCTGLGVSSLVTACTWFENPSTRMATSRLNRT